MDRHDVLWPWFTQNQMQLSKSLALLMLLFGNILLSSRGLKVDEGPLSSSPTPLPPIGHGAGVMVLQRAPNFDGTAVINGELVKISLSQFAGKYVVLLFYALDFSSICPTEITAFSNRLEEFHMQNTEIIACSVDSPYAHLAWLRVPTRESGLGKIRIHLLSDLTHKISKDYGVYMPCLGHNLRGLFIIDPVGLVRHITINDLSVGRSVDETLRLIKALNHVDRTGTPCPANWQPKLKQGGVLSKRKLRYPAT